MSVATIRLPETLSEELDRLAEVMQSRCPHSVIQAVNKYFVRVPTNV